MVRPVETVRTHRVAYLFDEIIPFWLHPESCPVHLVSWWKNEFDVKNPLNKESQCPCCNGQIPMFLLLALESERIHPQKCLYNES